MSNMPPDGEVDLGDQAPAHAARTNALSEDLEDVVARYCVENRSMWPPDVLAAELVRLRGVIDRLEVPFSAMSAHVAASHVPEEDDGLTAIGMLRSSCRMGSGAVAERICVGQQLGNLMKSVEAMEKGEIGYAHLALMARTADAVAGSATATACFDEDRLLHQAKALSVGRFRTVCRHVHHALDAAGVVASERDAADMRTLTLVSGGDGWVSLKGFFDPVAGEVIRTALEPLARPAGRDDHRPRNARLGDGLLELCHHGLDSGVVPDIASERAHVQVTTTLETLQGLAGAPAGEMNYRLAVSWKGVERMACDATIRRVLLDARSAVIDVGRSQRVVAPATRTALNVRDQGCRWPGCERPVNWTNAHHLQHWVHGGATDLANLVLLCWRHHWMVHEGGWGMAWGDGQDLVVVPPQVLRERARGPSAA